MTEIRQITAEYLDDSMALMKFAFQMNLSPERVASLKENNQPEWEFGLFDDDHRLLSRLSIIPIDVWIRGRQLAMGGVAGVASWPDARRQGGVKELLLHAFDRMRERGQSISMLAPFSFAFYRKFGYEMTIERKQYTLETKQLPRFAAAPGTVRIVAKDTATLNPVYQAYAARFDGMLARDGMWWESRVLSKPGIAAAYFDEAGEAQGYMLYEVANQTMKVHDWAALTEDAQAALWNYAANHDSMISQLTITVPMDDSLSFLVADPRFKQELIPYFMSRIIDAEKFVARYPFAAADQVSEVTLTIDDDHAPWNAGVYRLRIESDGTAALNRLDAAMTGSTSRPEAVGLSCDIATLTAMLLGGWRPHWLHRIGRLTGADDQVAVLERRAPLLQPYLADFF